MSGAWFSKKSSNFSVKSKTTAILIISTIEKKNVPRNFLMMYLSIFFKRNLCFYLQIILTDVYYSLTIIRRSVSSFHERKSPAMICLRASPTSHR